MGSALKYETRLFMPIQYAIIPLEDAQGQGDSNPNGLLAQFQIISSGIDFITPMTESGDVFYDGSGQAQNAIVQKIDGKIVEDDSWDISKTNNVNTLWNISLGPGNPNDGKVNNFVRFSDFANRRNLGTVLDLNGLEQNWIIIIDITGTFQIDEIVSQSTPSRTATLREVFSGNLLRVTDPSPNDFQEGELLTGQTSGATGTIVQFLNRI